MFDTWQDALQHFAFNGAAAAEPGTWPEDLGNHRVRVQVKKSAPAVSVTVPWRRRDKDPEAKGVVVVNAATGKRVKDCLITKMDRYAGEIVFKAETDGFYDIYYMPYIEKPHPVVYLTLYAPRTTTAGVEWLKETQFASCPIEYLVKNIPEAKIEAFQSMDDFHRFDSMEVVASQYEIDNMLAVNPGQDVLVFPEHRENPVRMFDYLPLRWICGGSQRRFEATVDRGEYFVFQAGIFAARADARVMHVAFSGLFSDGGAALTDIPFTCFNLGGVDWDGNKFTKKYEVKQGRVGSLWFGLDTSPEMAPGVYNGTVEIVFEEQEAFRFAVTLRVTENISADRGDSNLKNFSRLRWLNSTIGLEDFVTPPYTPVEFDPATLTAKILERDIRFNRFGVPQAIKSRGVDILARGLNLVVTTDTREVSQRASTMDEPELTESSLRLRANATNEGIDFFSDTTLDYDGNLTIALKVRFKQARTLRDIRLDVPLRAETAGYMMGMGFRGGVRPQQFEWKWDDRYSNNFIWVGDTNGGVQLKLRDVKDNWELFNLKAHGLPKSWDNGGRGGCRVFERNGMVIISAYSGERSVEAGEEVEFRFSLLITPVKPIDSRHWDWRYYHDDKPVDFIKDSGANIINVHHAYPCNPYLNYPFTREPEMRKYVADAHSHGIKTKIYYTIRELTDRVAEIWPLLALDHEIFTPGSGGGHSWLQEHLVEDYSTAWHHRFSYGDVDACIITQGLSRWHNYYLEGLAWLLRNTEIDGIYIDGAGFDRKIIRRIRRIMDSVRPGCLIDLHSGNSLDPEYGLTSPANIYMEHFPYIDSLWFGEVYDYNSLPDYWMVEISGIPMGLTGEMLQDQGNAWRGMIYGMHKRFYQGANPLPMWQFWDKFGIQGSEMLGYWDEKCPVATDRADVLVTAYLKADKLLLAVASWADGDADVKLVFRDDKLAARIKGAALTAPAIADFQDEAAFKLKDTIRVPKGKGLLLVADLTGGAAKGK